MAQAQQRAKAAMEVPRQAAQGGRAVDGSEAVCACCSCSIARKGSFDVTQFGGGDDASDDGVAVLVQGAVQPMAVKCTAAAAAAAEGNCYGIEFLATQVGGGGSGAGESPMRRGYRP